MHKATSLEAAAVSGVRFAVKDFTVIESIYVLDWKILDFRGGHDDILCFKLRMQSTSAKVSETASARQKSKEKKMIKKATSSNSFVQNVFRGMVEPAQVFPFPVALDEEQRENLEMLVPLAERVLEEQNDPLLNDQLETVPEDTINALAEVGAFGLQVPVELDGAGLNNSQYGRLTEVVGANDLGLGVFFTAHQSIGFKGILIAGTRGSTGLRLSEFAQISEFFQV